MIGERSFIKVVFMDNYVGSYIDLGFVFFGKKQKSHIFSCITYFLKKFKSTEYHIYLYRRADDDSEEYIVDSISEQEIKKWLSKDSFVVKFETVYNQKKLFLIFSNAMIEQYVAFQIDFHEESLYNCIGKKESLIFFETLMKDVYVISPFCYAFCDNNATTEFTLRELKDHGYKSYSLIAFPQRKSRIKFMRQQWELDGQTMRNEELVGEYVIKL